MASHASSHGAGASSSPRPAGAPLFQQASREEEGVDSFLGSRAHSG